MHLPGSIRRLTDPVLERIPVPIASGVNRGLWWSLASAGRGHASGIREARRLRCIRSVVKPGDVVWDVGANKGYITLCAARRAGKAGSVHAFEPSEHSRLQLARHVAWNGLTNVVIHPFALSSYNGRDNFGGTGSSLGLHLGGGGAQVEVRTADSLIASGSVPAPTFVKVDVEGAEAGLLQGAGQMLRNNARLMIALHSRDLFVQCRAILLEAGNTLLESRAMSGWSTDYWFGDPDLYAAGPACADTPGEAGELRGAGF